MTTTTTSRVHSGWMQVCMRLNTSPQPPQNPAPSILPSKHLLGCMMQQGRSYPAAVPTRSMGVAAARRYAAVQRPRTVTPKEPRQAGPKPPRRVLSPASCPPQPVAPFCGSVVVALPEEGELVGLVADPVPNSSKQDKVRRVQQGASNHPKCRGSMGCAGVPCTVCLPSTSVVVCADRTAASAND